MVAGIDLTIGAGCHRAIRNRYAGFVHVLNGVCDVTAARIGLSSGEKTMFIAMNRFRVKRGAEDDFEKVWLSRDSHLERVPGFVEFHLLKGPEAEDHTLYASHTVWRSKAVFEAWTKSGVFRVAHARAGNDMIGPLYLEHPKFEGFEVRQTVNHKGAARWSRHG